MKRCKNILTVYLLFTRAHHITVVIWTKTMIHRHSHQQPATAAHQISSEEVSAQCTEDNGSAGHPHHPPHPTSTYSSYQWSIGKLNQNPNANHFTIKYWCRSLTCITHSRLCILCLYVWVLYCIEAAHILNGGSTPPEDNLFWTSEYWNISILMVNLSRSIYIIYTILPCPGAVGGGGWCCEQWLGCVWTHVTTQTFPMPIYNPWYIQRHCLKLIHPWSLNCF